ncbi:MAG TPA: hypothetical protein VNA20_12850 [Frankiaceae bacterium]|nr:hypothetical protein [Frankiaceae bacterium]
MRNALRIGLAVALTAVSFASPSATAQQATQRTFRLNAADLNTDYTTRERAADLLAASRGEGAVTFRKMYQPRVKNGVTYLSWVGSDRGGDVLVTAAAGPRPVLLAFEPATAQREATLHVWTLASADPRSPVVSSRRLSGADLPRDVATSSADNASGECALIGFVIDVGASFVCGPVCSHSVGVVANAYCEALMGQQKPPGYYENPPYVHWFGNSTDPYGQQSRTATVYADSGGYVSHVADFEIIPPTCAPNHSTCKLANGQAIRNRFVIRYYWPNGVIQTVGVGYTSAMSLAYITQQSTYLEEGDHLYFVMVESQVEGALTDYYLGGVSRVLTVKY